VSWYRAHQLLTSFAARFCRHPEGVICPHRQYEYDQWQRGYGKGFTSGKGNMESKWLGSITGEGVYADYPPPLPPANPSLIGTNYRRATGSGEVKG
jgi:hypothetical protein